MNPNKGKRLLIDQHRIAEKKNILSTHDPLALILTL